MAVGDVYPEAVAQMRARGGDVPAPRMLRELSSGVDALYLSGRAELPSRLVDDLEVARTTAATSKLGSFFELSGRTFRLLPHGWGRYRFVLVNEMGRIGLTTSSHLPALRIQPASAFLHAIGVEPALFLFNELVGTVAGEVTLSISRLDLYVDVTGWTLTADDRHRFVTRAEAVRTFEEGGTLTGITFGARSSGTLCARIYDKTADVAVKGTDWWYAVWGERWRPGDPVTRVEFEFGREGLGQFGIDSPADALSAVGDLWSYATTSWLTYRASTPDRTKSRWPIAPEWIDVSRADLATETIGLERTRNGARSGSLRKLLPALNGYLASFAAIVGTDDIADTTNAVGPYLRDYETLRRVRFADRVRQRRAQHSEHLRVGGGGE